MQCLYIKGDDPSSHRLLFIKSMVPTLPIETITHILDYLHDDSKALATCSLASAALMTIARRHLFREVTLECSSICTFMRLLDVPWCTIPSAMSRMILCDKRRRVVYPQVVYTPTNRLRLISHLQAVEFIKFHDVSLENIPPPFWRLLHQLERVKELEIQQMSFKSPIEFFRYICTLPALEALSISRSSIDVAATDLAPFRLKAPFCIPFLDVGRLSPGIFQWFLKQDPVPLLHTFRIKLGAASANTTMLQEFVKVVGPSVQSLQVTLPSDFPSHQTLPPLNFSPFTNVRSVYIEGYLRLGEPRESCQMADLTQAIFTQIASGLLEKVSLNYSLHIDETMLFFGFPIDVILKLFLWGTLPGTLSEKCEHLRSLHFSIRGLPSFQRKGAEESFRNGPFTVFQDRNILSVAFL